MIEPTLETSEAVQPSAPSKTARAPRASKTVKASKEAGDAPELKVPKVPKAPRAARTAKAPGDALPTSEAAPIAASPGSAGEPARATTPIAGKRSATPRAVRSKLVAESAVSAPLEAKVSAEGRDLGTMLQEAPFTLSSTGTKPSAAKARKVKSPSKEEAVTPVADITSGVETEASPAKKVVQPRARKVKVPSLSSVVEVEAAAPAYPEKQANPSFAQERDTHIPYQASAQTHTSEVLPVAQRHATEVQEPPRKPYPVYVPRHVAKQMEQEGKEAPLAVPSDAEQASAIRAAAFENRHGSSQQREGAQTAQHPEDERRREDHRDGRHAREPRDHRDSRDPRGERHPRDARDPRRAQNPPGHRDAAQAQHPRPNPQDRPHERGPDREPREPRRGRNDRNDRNERRRGGHPDERSEGGGREHGREHSREHGRELPPPTPEELFPGEGLIEISGKGFGFLRDPAHNFSQHPADIFVSPELVRRFNLKDGHWIKGSVRKSGRGQQIHEIHTVNGDAPESCRLQPAFDELTVINPSEPLKMETEPERYTTRIIDMIAPIGKGQRGLIVAQPRTGKTTLLQHIADAMMKNHPDVHLIMLLVDERPEEVTEIRHTVPKAEIMASSNDMDVRSHTRIAELAIERAKRLVESGRDVFILLDSITRLGRAFNNAMTNGGRTMSGGIDARAMEVPRRLFAAARNTEEAGSLTIIATALIDTGSRMDEIIFQEFKGTGNMELVLDRKIAEQRIYPAVDIFQSGTRREELLVPADLLQKIYFLRRGLSGAKPLDAIDRLLFYLKKFSTNEQMLREIKG